MRRRKKVLKLWRADAVSAQRAVEYLRSMGVRDRHGAIWMMSPSANGAIFGKADGSKAELCDLSEFRTKWGHVLSGVLISLSLLSFVLLTVSVYVLVSQ